MLQRPELGPCSRRKRCNQLRCSHPYPHRQPHHFHLRASLHLFARDHNVLGACPMWRTKQLALSTVELQAVFREHNHELSNPLFKPLHPSRPKDAIIHKEHFLVRHPLEYLPRGTPPEPFSRLLEAYFCHHRKEGRRLDGTLFYASGHVEEGRAP